ncbi:transcription-repair coupling factor, partial [Candidatus Aerophobetes bacterium]|nr:transcription-repair coupling factor [Candidatus Aerophobetes bacterium]
MIKSAKKDFLTDVFSLKDFPCWLQGLVPEAKGYGIFLLWERLERSLLCIIQDQEKAERIYEDIKTFLERKVFFLPPADKLKKGEIYNLLQKIEEEENPVLIASAESAFQKVVPPNLIFPYYLKIEKGKDIPRDELVKWLVEKGYHSSPMVESKAEFSVRGSIVDIFSPSSENPVRIEFFADTVESIREFDISTQRSIKNLKNCLIFPLCDEEKEDKFSLLPFYRLLSRDFFFVLDEPLEIEARLKGCPFYREWESLKREAHFFISTLPQTIEGVEVRKKIIFHSSSVPSYRGNIELLSEDIKKWQSEGYRIIIVTASFEQARRFKEFMRERGFEFDLTENFSRQNECPFLITVGDIQRGFVLKETKEVIISDADVFQRFRQKRAVKLDFEEKIKSWDELKEGDYVVHVDYGIGKFRGLVSLKVMGKWGDYFRIDYRGEDKLYVPFSQLDRVHKYIGDSDTPPPIYSLEGAGWELTKRRVKKATRELAASLLKLYSIRKTQPGYSFSPDTPWQFEFEASFPYEETPDQLNAIHQVKEDMESPFPMDRLICGDSGYGKTEVAIRASFKAVMDSKQVAVLVPTTILAEQHLRTFRERMRSFPVRVEMLSRFQSKTKQREIIKDLEEGKVDIIIGTHRLLQDDVKFRDLGLVIIDEEHRFGVTQKKKLKELKKTVDVLALSATPIPRSLYMALTGIYKLSTIFSPPQERQEIEVEVAEYNEEIIKKAIERELSRGGQVFYLYNRVKDIGRVAEKVKMLIPGARIVLAHGQMSSSRLERTIMDFIRGKYDILVCTSIIEAGIDMPNVNTLIVENSEQFGLADLYQIRGRVGRGSKKGYVYFLFRPEKILTDEAKRRLQIIQEFKGSGSGFKIAMEDLQIRGAGNLLGKEQHGHMAAVGFTLYSQLLSEEIKKLKGEKVAPSFPVQIELGVEARIPPSFVPSEIQRL